MSGRPPRREATRLDEKILAAFRQACREGQLDVAEHLMRGLETLAEPLDGGSRPPSACACLDEAYQVIAEGLPPEVPKVGRGRNRTRIAHKH